MQLSSALAKLPGIARASLVMATRSNLALLGEAGVLHDSVDADRNDLLIQIEGDSDAGVSAALEQAVQALQAPPREQAAAGDDQAIAPLSIEMALDVLPEANLALISVPGEYAGPEAMKALRLGLNVMLFSDNVALEEEVRLKELARERGLLLMGPDCGTAMIGGTPLGFANQVRAGDIGCISASGTGLQQVACLVHRWGGGISQAIGTGSRDLSQQVGGITMLRALQLLADDEKTRVIVLISKPPHPRVAELVLAEAAALKKPVVICFIGMHGHGARHENVHAVRTLDEAARAACALAGRVVPSAPVVGGPGARPRSLQGRQRYIRGLYCGGTFCYEASLLLGETFPAVWSNAAVESTKLLIDAWQSREHSVVDLGDDLFTRGRPHPMIDHRMRNERIVLEASDPDVAVILFDVVLGYGAHPDPAGEMLPSLQAARAAATKRGQDIAFVGFVCGTEKDPQNFGQQETALQQAGVTLATSNAEAVRVAAAIAGRTEIETEVRAR